MEKSTDRHRKNLIRGVSTFKQVLIVMTAPLPFWLVAAAPLFVSIFSAEAFTLDDDATNAAANIGERLFLETRFSQFFFTNCDGDVNAIVPNITNSDYTGGEIIESGDTNVVLTNGDPVMAMLKTIYGPQPGPFAGLSMNCRQCHLVNEMQNSRGVNCLGNRTYCDFSTHSPIPNIGDGNVVTPRRSPTLVNALLGRSSPMFLHWDGQFATPQELVIETMTGRNYGWKPTQYATAIHHIANVIRYDNGRGALANSRYGGGYSYATMFAFPPEEITTFYRLPFQYWFGDLTETNTNDPFYVSDDEIVQAVADLIVQYLETLVFSKDDNGHYDGSPYDVFLRKNGLPQSPRPGETPLQYSQRLLGLVKGLTSPQFVNDPVDGHFLTHNQIFQFGALELEGLRIFLQTNSSGTIPVQPPFITIVQSGRSVTVSWIPTAGTLFSSPDASPSASWKPVGGQSPYVLPAVSSAMFFKVAAPATVRAAGRSGNCVLCHAPPDFTDFIFHNTGASQADYDSIHGEGAFSRVWIPDLATRQSNYDAYLPPTTNHPYATGRFRMPPRRTDASYMDLGLWNVFDNPDYPAPQAGLQKVLTNEFPNAITADALLQSTIGLVKTPTLRDLGQCQPYLHTGQMRTIEDVIEFDREFAEKARQGKVQNGDPQLKYESVDEKSVAALAAFIRALNEDYTD